MSTISNNLREAIAKMKIQRNKKLAEN